MQEVDSKYLKTLSESLSPNIFRELHDCIQFNRSIRLEIPFKNTSRISESANKLNLSFSISDKSFEIVIDRGMDDWASSLVDCSDNDLNAMRFAYLHSDKEICESAKQFDAIDDELNLGLLLNYPKCCIESYLNWQMENEDIDPITIITESYQFNGQINNFDFPNPFSRYFGSGLFSHFPCSLSCSHTKKIAEESLNSLRTNFPVMADTILQFENSLVIFHKEMGVCIWSRFNLSKNKIQLDKYSFHGQGKLKFIFETVDEIEFSNKIFYLKSTSNKTTTFTVDGCLVGIFNFS